MRAQQPVETAASNRTVSYIAYSKLYSGPLLPLAEGPERQNETNLRRNPKKIKLKL